MQVRNNDVINHIQLCVGVLCHRNGQVLLIKRSKDPQKGQWSIPGGRVEFGETMVNAAKRELFEETGIIAEIEDVIGRYEFIGSDYHYVVFDYFAQWVANEPVAGSDAEEAVFLETEVAFHRVASEDLKCLIKKMRAH